MAEGTGQRSPHLMNDTFDSTRDLFYEQCINKIIKVCVICAPFDMDFTKLIVHALFYQEDEFYSTGTEKSDDMTANSNDNISATTCSFLLVIFTLLNVLSFRERDRRTQSVLWYLAQGHWQ